jgi:hypothetical protein
MTVKQMTKKFGLINFGTLASGAGRTEVEKRVKALRSWPEQVKAIVAKKAAAMTLPYTVVPSYA